MSKTGKEEAGGPHGGNGVRKGKEGLHVNDTPRKGPILKVIREHAFLDWMVLSMLMLLLGLVYFGEGFGFIYLLVVGGFFGNLMLLNYMIRSE